MVFTHQVRVHYPTSVAPGADEPGAHLSLFEVIEEMASRNLTGDLQSSTRESDGATGSVFTRTFTSEAAAQEFVGHVQRLFPTLEHVSTIIQL